MIYSDSRGQSEELQFIKEKRKTCKHSTAEQRMGEKKEKHTKQSCMEAVRDHMTISYENTIL